MDWTGGQMESSDRPDGCTCGVGQADNELEKWISKLDR